jgi:hypothetical protein
VDDHGIDALARGLEEQGEIVVAHPSLRFLRILDSEILV